MAHPRSPRTARATACIPALALALAAGCGGAGDGGGRAPGGATSGATAERNATAALEVAEARHDSLTAARAQVPDWPDAAPPEARLPADVLEALRGGSESWLFAWRIGLGTFRPDQLARTWTRPLPDGREPYDGNAPGEDLRLTFLATPGPDGTSALDPYGAWTLEEEREIVHARRAQAPAVSLIDLAGHQRRRLLELGDRDARIDGAQWVDSTRILVFAGERFTARPWTGGPVLYLVDLRRNTVTRYAGPGGDADGYEAVERELDRRFRKQLSALVFDGV